MTDILDERVKFFCCKLCEELRIDPNENWETFQEMVQDWLVNEAFHKVRNDYWNKKFDVPDYDKETIDD